jgi:4-amino-4-deoxy-L-arabinose transferase-like glycosyltransferase
MRRDLRDDLSHGCLVFGLALAARIAAFAAAFDPNLAFEKYLLLARRLVASGFALREPWAFSPLYTCFAAALLKIGASVRGIAIAQVILGALACVLVMTLGRRLFGRSVGLLAGIGAAIYGPFLVSSIELEADGVGMLVFLLAAVAVARGVAGGSAGWFLVAGIALGLRAVHRPDALLLLVAVPLALLLASPRTAPRSLLMVPAVLVVVAPITWQNWKASREFIPVTSSGGWVLYTSHNWQAHGLSYFPPPLAWERMNAPPGVPEARDRLDDRVSDWLAALAEGREMSPWEASRFWRREAVAAVRRRGALAQAALQARRLFYMLHGYEAHDDLALLLKMERLGCFGRGMGWLAPLALLGLVVSCAKRGFFREHGAWLLPFLLLPVLSMSLFYVGARFRLELAALLLPFAAAAVVALGAALRERRFAAAGVGAVLVAALALPLNLPDAEIARQERLRFVQLHTFLGRRALPGDPAHAEEELRRAVAAAATPGEAADAWQALATPLEARGDADGAGRARATAAGLLEEPELSHLNERDDDPDALWAVARHHLLRREPAEAAEVLRRVVAIAPEDPDYAFALASAAFDAGGTPADAILARLEEAFTSGLRFTTNAAAGHVLEGRLLLMLDRNAEARRAFAAALRYEPDNPIARRLLSGAAAAPAPPAALAPPAEKPAKAPAVSDTSR